MAAGDWKELLQAVQNGNLRLVKYHIENGVDPNYQHPELLTTPLIESIEYQEPAITAYLLENGANPRLKAGFSTDSPMSVAKRMKNQAAINLLKPYYPSFLKRLFSRKGGGNGIGENCI
ncbi:MAG: ankyrin repeat domain-containing protein [Bacteroidetes bacterium]|nr:ankyrin repeat domain-containing protein [Bacteroidota bacterium]